MHYTQHNTKPMFVENISNDEINQLPKLQFEGKAVVVSSPADIPDGIVDEMLGGGVVGFDTETKPMFKPGRRNPTALLQLATERLALLVRLQHAGLPDPIIRLLESPNVLKVGVAVHDDIKGLQRVKMFSPNGFIDLQAIVPRFGIEAKGLRKMAAIVLGGRISKSQQLSNWEADIYTEAQIHYAATDAWVGRQMYMALLHKNTQITKP